jgi:hypothetical protein
LYEYKCSRLKVEVFDRVLVGVDKVFDRVILGFENSFLDIGKVFFSFLKLACSDSEEVQGRHWHVEWRGHKGSLSQVKGEERLCSMGDPVRGSAGGLLYCNTFGPHDRQEHQEPEGFIFSSSFDK